MADTKELKIVINGDVKDAEGALNQFSSRVGSISPLAIAAGVALERLGEKVISMGIDFVKGSVKAYEESQNLNTQLSAVLKSTGEAAGLTKDQLIDLSKQLQSSTTFSDEQVLSAENLLLTFTKIGKETFPDATTAVLNMATALGELT
jgi:phage-related minor tail protein